MLSRAWNSTVSLNFSDAVPSAALTASSGSSATVLRGAAAHV
jgi:hypothetical protein